MDLKRLITQFTYRIEPKAEGGFIAHASDATLPPLEATTREELQQKIQANISTALTNEFPGLKLPTGGSETKFAFHIERKPDGGLAIHSADPSTQSIKGSTHEDIANHFLEKLVNFVGKEMTPDLVKAIAAQGTGEVRVVVKRNIGFPVNSLPGNNIFGSPVSNLTGKTAEDPTATANFNGSYQALSASPITPEANGVSKIFRFLLVALIVLAFLYFVFRHR